MANSCLYVSRIASGSIVSSGNVVFDTVLYNTGGISYNLINGTVTFNETGIFHINWWMAVQTTVNAGGSVFALVSSKNDIIYGDTPLKTSSFSGLGVINVTTPPVTLSLKNMGTGYAYLASTLPVKSMMSIVKESIDSGSESMLSFQYAQLTNILSQIIALYPENITTVYALGLYAIEGTPVSIYKSPEASGYGIFTSLDSEADNLQAIPLNTIMAIKIGETAVYDNSITYLTPPSPLPIGWDTNVIVAVHDYLPVGSKAVVYWGIGNSKEGIVLKNEYGMLVMATDLAGNDPYFILPTASLIIITASEAKIANKIAKESIKSSKLLKFNG
jgi:hypothetical protein